MHGPVVRSDRLTARPFLLRTADARRRVARTRAEILPGSPAPPRAYASRSPPGPSTTRRCGRYTDLTVSRGPSSPEDRAAGRVWGVTRPARWPDQTSGIGRFVERLRSTLGPNARQSLAALGLNSATSFVAGGVLGSITATFARVPGLLVLVPAAIGLRGNIFGAFGNRISTADPRRHVPAVAPAGDGARPEPAGRGGAHRRPLGRHRGGGQGRRGRARHRGHRRRARPRGDLDRRRRARVDRRDGGHAAADRRRGPPGLGPRQRHRPDRERAR